MSNTINIEERVARAVALFKTEGYSCAQAVLLAYADLFDLDENLAATLAAPFGGGIGRLREVCGTVSGMCMIAGLRWPNADPKDTEAKKRLYAVEQELAEKFRAENGSIVCRELLGLSEKKDSPTPSPRTPQYYAKRPCAEYVAISARIIGEKLKAVEGN
ncbi:MAG: C-GCAxxG-C-C family protein [Prevotellaceae bacterium]|jgi:C_GCAxxG_C_C family probable redox protein|nr:C-GCAxxG-C-C family protein [Prevotellaceae bacterium]